MMPGMAFNVWKKTIIGSNNGPPGLIFYRAVPIFAALAVVNCSDIMASENSAGGLNLSQNAASISVFDGTRLVFRYRYVENPFKPYSDRFVSPAGVQILLDSPWDHKHHHGLMFALKVDGVSFWEEKSPKYGRQRHRSLRDAKTSIDGDVATARFSQTLDWIGPKSEKPLLTEERSIVVFKAADLGATLIQWRSRLQSPPGKDSVTLSGNSYHGLGLRFIRSMDNTGRFFNSDDKTGAVIRNDEQLTPAKWCAYAAKADGKPVTAAIFDRPENVSHPAVMFTMTKPFAYLSATLDGWKKPLILKADAPLELTYGVALWDGEVDKAAVEKLYQRWLKLESK